MIVMKFGGSSIADAPRLRSVADLIAARTGGGVIVVVSALAGVTDLLDAAARCAERRDGAGVERALSGIEANHSAALEAVEDLGERGRVAERAKAILGEARLLLRGQELLGEVTPRSVDAILAAGERISSHLLASVLAGRGLPARRIDARRIVITDGAHGAAAPLPDRIASRCTEELLPVVGEGGVPVLGGFIASTIDGITSTLGRGGSDLTASLLAAACGASELQIWTDVDGMMTADPRLVPKARPLARVSFDEAAELATFGAKVLHPATIHPAVERDIPVRVLNTLRPSAAGTLITRRSETASGPVRAIACKPGLTVVTVASTRMLMAHGFLARIFEVFDRHRTPVDLVSTSEVSVSLTVDDPRRIEPICRELSEFATVRVEEGMAIVCLVGEELLRRKGIAARVFEALRQVNVRMISLGASEINLSIVVSQEDATASVRSLHDAFFDA